MHLVQYQNALSSREHSYGNYSSRVREAKHKATKGKRLKILTPNEYFRDYQ